MLDKHSDASPLNILLLSADTYPPFRVDVTILFGKQMRKFNHHIDWVLQSEPECGSAYEESWEGWKVYVGATDHGSSRLRRARKHFLNLRNDLRIFRITKKVSYDFVLVKDKFLAALLAIVCAKYRKCGFVYWLSYPFPEASLYEAKIGTARYRFLYYIRGIVFKFILYRIVASAAEHIFVQSEQMKRDLVKEGVPGEKISAVPMGYSPEMVESIRPDSTTDSRVSNFVYVGTLLKTRRLDFLVRVLAIVVKKIPDVLLYMVGPEELPGDCEVLRTEAKRLGVSKNLVLTGRLERTTALSYVACADVCVSPFFPTPILNSTSPTKLVEYMALKKAVVANDHPEQLLVISESQGGICVEYDEVAFAKGIIMLLEDKTLAKAMGERGYEYVRAKRTYSRIAAEVEKQFLRIREERISKRPE